MEVTPAADPQQWLLVFDPGANVVVGVVLAMAMLTTVSTRCGYFYSSWNASIGTR